MLLYRSKLMHLHLKLLSIRTPPNLRNLRNFFKVRLLLYNTYISCHFNFCPLVWHFCSQSSTDKLERLQYRALRFVFADYESDYDALLVKAKMPTLELARQRQICTQVFKCVHKLAPQYLSSIYTFQDKSIHNTS